ncbi:diadenylate cyclase [Ruminiclostridium sufflavum DSM 19573]|uniref:Diadenylate cyclase n=1 Tax=Ruminiclostridium sufflavum DSM 19573 TaxID=1121337 RepID=A0A318XJZ2_9FIRM|nr:diadenylate cyclase CdaA [Ruminiclostridium sufflavum]PYG87329.1 diadenylate cyclase [Ruminiclostridium sufflavum DSM 19573]
MTQSKGVNYLFDTLIQNFQNIINFISIYIPINDPLEMLKSFIDISIVSYIIFKLIQLGKETRAWQLVKGIVVIFVIAMLSEWLQLRTLAFILNKTIELAGFAVVVLFQPELRRGLEQLGRSSNIRDLFNFDENDDVINTTYTIEEIVRAATELSKTKTGALIVVERETKLGEIINTGTTLDSSISAELIINIFTPNTPLHDGALIVRDNKLKSAACFLPLTDNPNLSKELGTRHRAALGITEVSDCISVVVSEETGKISYALNGGLSRNLTPDTLRKALNKNLLEKKSVNKKLSLWKGKSK